MTFFYADFIRKLAQNRIEAQQILKGLMISNIADGPQPDILVLVQDSKEVSPDPAKTH
jgi:hypothetical protein